MTENETVAPSKVKQDLLADVRARFRAGRLAAGFSLARTGAAAGVSLQAIGQFEQGRQGLQLVHFVTACAAMRLDVKWVLQGVGEMFDGARPVGGRKGGRRASRVQGGPFMAAQ